MAVDTPATIAILGAGPIGLEAALYARFLGYDVVIYEAGSQVAAAVRQWGHVRMFTPFGMNRSPLGLSALRAQDESYLPPAEEELLTGREWASRYLAPLSQTDLLADHLRLNTKVIRIGKGEVHKDEMPGHEDRGDWPFRLLVRGPDGIERLDEADVVIDTTGVFAAQPRWCGYGGIPAAGEMSLRERGAIEYRLPEILGQDRSLYAGKHTLLIGAGYSAATNAVALAQLVREAPATRVTWITRREGPASAGGPMALISDDRLAERDRLAREANALTNDPDSGVTYLPGNVVEAIEKTQSGEHSSFQVLLAGSHEGTHAFDRIIANVGFTPDRSLYEELQVHECYATLGPMKLAAALSGSDSGDCLDQKTCGPNTLLNPEPNFYILGAKSYGRKSGFLLSVGLEQIREVFTIIGDRETLDLYGSGVGFQPAQ
jgi:thioredoxin reductase